VSSCVPHGWNCVCPDTASGPRIPGCYPTPAGPPSFSRRSGPIHKPSAARIAGPSILLAAVLSLPVLGLGYFWDDFVFLARVQSHPLAAFGPEPGLFYRPLARVLYFWPLAGLGTSGAIVAHVANLALLALALVLLVSLVRDLGDDRAAAFAALLFAGLAPVACLIAWASASQDLLAILFSLAALRLRSSGRILASGIAVAAALLSKETAVCMIPVLVLWDWIVGRRPGRVRAGALAFGGLALAWAFLHPGIRALAARGFEREPRAYVGFANLAVSEFHARHYLLSLVNAPGAPGSAAGGTNAAAWTLGRILIGGSAIAIVLAGILVAPGRGAEDSPRAALSVPRAALLALFLTLPALALPALMIQRWAAYFVCMPALGVSLFLGMCLARAPAAFALAVLAAYVGIGFWSRPIDTPGADALTERTFADASRAIRDVERGFRSLRPVFPRGSQVLVSVASSGLLGIDGTMHDGQALRTFYRDPTLRTLRPERRAARPRAEFLYRITGTRDVVEIDPDLGTYRSSGAAPDTEEIRAITRTYARGLSATGEAERAVRILGRLASGDEPAVLSYDLRLAAMGRMAEGNAPGAKHLLEEAPPLTREGALHGVSEVMSEPTGNAGLDSCAYAAFGVSSSDPEALRALMDLFYASQFVPQAIHFAKRLQEVAPGDSESGAILGELR
jgi:hypothetical protein